MSMMMTVVTPSPFLRRVLRFDALSCQALGLPLAVAAEELAGPFGGPVLFWQTVGWLLLPVAAILWALAGRNGWPTLIGWGVIALNSLWVLASVGLVLSGAVALTGLGVALVLGQAAAVAVLVELEIIGLRRSLKGAMAGPRVA